MELTKIKIAIYLVLFASIILEIFFMQKLGINSIGASIIFYFLGIAPYLLLGFLFKKEELSIKKNILNLVGTTVISMGGFLIIIDALYIHPDPQGGLAILIVPFLQFILIGIMFLISQANYFQSSPQ